MALMASSCPFRRYPTTVTASFHPSSASSSSSPQEPERTSDSLKLREDWRKRSRPIRPGGVYPAKEHCSRCGLCDTYYIAHVKDACAFLGEGMSRIEVLESKVHGRGRNLGTDELHFGVHDELLYARKTKPVAAIQRTGSLQNLFWPGHQKKFLLPKVLSQHYLLISIPLLWLRLQE